MAEIVWTDPAISDLDAIADYIALYNPDAARGLVQKVFNHVDKLIDHPKLGSVPVELEEWHYRQIVESPFRVFYRQDGNRIYIVHVMRNERQLDDSQLEREFERDC